MYKVFSQIRWFVEKILHWISSQYWEWWTYFKIRARRFFVSLWNLFGIYSVLVFLFTAILVILVVIHNKTISPEKLLDFNTMTSMTLAWLALGGGAIVFVIMFILFVILSSFPKGRNIADKYFRFAKPTKSEQFEDEIQRRLAALERFKKVTEKKLEVTKKEKKK